MYESITPHIVMLGDRVRTNAYEKAILETIRPGSTVLDFGCGTGILSFFAARAGAGKVYAVDRSRFIRVAKELADLNGFENIEFFYGDHTIDLPSKVDFIISEWMGYFVFQEQMLNPLLTMRDRWLEPSGLMIPERIVLKAALVIDADLRDQLDLLHNRAYDLNFSLIADWPAHEVLVRKCSTDQVIESTVDLGSLQMKTCTGLPEELRGTVILTQDALVQGLCGWFDTLLTEQLSFGTGPFDPPTHWNQLVFPLKKPLAVHAGQTVGICIRPQRTANSEHTSWSWSVETDDVIMEMDDTVHRAWIARPLHSGRLV